MMNKPILVAFITVMLGPVYVFSEAHEIYFVDAHSQADSEKVLAKIISLMDRAGVKMTILSARRKLSSDDVADFADRHPQRIIAAVRTKGRAYAENRKGFYRNLEKDMASGRYGAIAELLLYHGQKGAKAEEFIVYPQDQRVLDTLRYAKKNGWPLVVHIEFASLGEKKRTKFMAQLEQLLDEHQDQAFALIHMGQLSADEVRRLLSAHGNIYFMTSHTNPLAVSKSDQPWTPMFKGDTLAPEWQELVINHPDRFILAFDNVWPEHWGDFYLQEVQFWRKALAALPNDVAQAIAHGNAERLWKISEE